MQKIIVKYAPIIVAAEPEDGTYKDTMRFNLAAKLDSISTNDHGAYYLFFRAQHKQVPAVSFKVTKTVFGDRKETVAARIKGKVESLFSDDIPASYNTRTCAEIWCFTASHCQAQAACAIDFEKIF